MCCIPELISVIILTKQTESAASVHSSSIVWLHVFLSILLHNVIFVDTYILELISILYSSGVCNCSVVLKKKSQNPQHSSKSLTVYCSQPKKTNTSIASRPSGQSSRPAFWYHASTRNDPFIALGDIKWQTHKSVYFQRWNDLFPRAEEKIFSLKHSPETSGVQLFYCHLCQETNLNHSWKLHHQSCCHAAEVMLTLSRNTIYSLHTAVSSSTLKHANKPEHNFHLTSEKKNFTKFALTILCAF